MNIGNVIWAFVIDDDERPALAGTSMPASRPSAANSAADEELVAAITAASEQK